ncbi:MAG: DNA polymerase III subunit delta [Oscillospiraceae bacterium]|nr:DNA polymerase III subunit delta [Oscillospiraceae bacterium]
MRFENENAMKAHIESGALLPVYLLYGEESMTVERWATRLIKEAVGDTQDPFLLTRMDGREGVDPDELSDAAEALPFMAPRKCVTVEDFDPDALSSTDFSKLEQLLSDPPPTCVMVFTMKSRSPEPSRKKGEEGGSKGKKLLKLVEAKGAAAHFGVATASDAGRLARDTAKKLGCVMPNQVSSALVAACGGNLHAVVCETEKLCAYAGGGELTLQQLQQVGVQSVEASVFDLSRAILRMDYTTAMAIVSNLMFLRESPVGVLTILSSAFVDLYRAKAARSGHITDKQAMKDLGYLGGRTFLYTRAAESESRYSHEFLVKALETLTQADQAMKSTGADGRVLLEQTVTKLFVLLKEDR